MRQSFLVAVLAAVWFPSTVHAEPNAEEIVKRSLETFYASGRDMQTRVQMVLTNANGQERRRELTMSRKNMGPNGDQRYFIYFHAPADVRGTTFLIWKYPTKDDDRWIFIPAVKLVRRIAASDKRSSFVGSDFTYEDVSGRDIGDENHKFLRTEELAGRPCFVIESQPKLSADYARRLSWIDSERWLPLQEEHYDARGAKIRLFVAGPVEQVGGHFTMMKRTMQDLQTGHRTDVTFDKVIYDQGLADDIFTERSLRGSPASVR